MSNIFWGSQNARQTQRICAWSETCGSNWWNVKGACSITLPQTTPKSKPTIAAAHRYHPFTDKATGERCPVTQEEAGQIVSQVIHQELRGQINRQRNYQTTRGRRSLQGHSICDFCNWSGHVLATCLQWMRQMQGKTSSSRNPKILNFNRPLQRNSNWGSPNYIPRTQNQQQCAQKNWLREFFKKGSSKKLVTSFVLNSKFHAATLIRSMLIPRIRHTSITRPEVSVTNLENRKLS